MSEILLIEQGETAEEVVAYAAKYGIQISREQLKYWRETEAIPPLGSTLGGQKGQGRWVYPPGTSRQALVLARLLKRGMSLSDATWRLWRRGFPIGPRWKRRRLQAVATQLDAWLEEAQARAVISGGDALSDELLDHLETNPRLYNTAIAKSRKLLGKKRFATYVFLILRLPLGRYGDAFAAEMKDEDQTILLRGLGLDRRFVDRFPMAVQPKITDAADSLKRLAATLEGVCYRELIEESTDSDIEKAGLELIAIRSNHRFLFMAFEWLYGPHALGLGHGIRTAGQFKPDQQVAFLVVWLAVRRDAQFRAGARKEVELMRTGDALKAFVRSIEFRTLLSNSPVLAAIWTPEFIHRSWRLSRTHPEHAERLRRAVAQKLIEVIAVRGRQSE